MTTLSESSLELAALDIQREQGHAVIHGPEIEPGKPDVEPSGGSEA